ncbi:uncharacterized protein [Ptychodera flava]|uniref:uncharacterized protein isoform X2 n=1 Tax=Ptychodera flava TaxID=63121 RepID=UPI00396AAC42
MIAVLGEKQPPKKYGRRRYKGFIRVTKKGVDGRPGDIADETLPLPPADYKDSSNFDLGITSINDRKVRLPTIDESIDQALNREQQTLLPGKQKGKGKKYSQLPDLHHGAEPQGNKNAGRLDFSLSIMGQDLQLPPPRTPTEPLKRQGEKPRHLNYVGREGDEDVSVLHKQLEELLMCHSMGIPIEIVKRDFKPGTVARPVFHCPRCLSHWKEYGLLPDKCEELAIPTRGPTYRLNTQSSKLLQNLNDLSDTEGSAIIIKHDSQTFKNVPIRKSTKKGTRGNGGTDGQSKLSDRSNSSSTLECDSASDEHVGDSSSPEETVGSQGSGGVQDDDHVKGADKTTKPQHSGPSSTETEPKLTTEEKLKAIDKHTAPGEGSALSGRPDDKGQADDAGKRGFSPDTTEGTTQADDGIEPSEHSGVTSQSKTIGPSFAVGTTTGQIGPDGAFYPGSYGPDGRFIPAGRVGKDGKFQPLLMGPDGKYYINAKYGPDGTFYPGDEIGMAFKSAADMAKMRHDYNVRGPDGLCYPGGSYDPDGRFRPGGPPQPEYGPDGRLLRGVIGPNGLYYPNGYFDPDGTFHPGGQIGPDGQFYSSGHWGPNGHFYPNGPPSVATTVYGPREPGSFDRDQPTQGKSQRRDALFSDAEPSAKHLPYDDMDRQVLDRFPETDDDHPEGSWGGDFEPQFSKIPGHYASDESHLEDSRLTGGKDTDDGTSGRTNGRQLLAKRKRRKGGGPLDGGWVEGIEELDEDEAEGDFSEGDEEGHYYDKEMLVDKRDTSEGYFSDNSRDNSKTGTTSTAESQKTDGSSFDDAYYDMSARKTHGKGIRLKRSQSIDHSLGSADDDEGLEGMDENICTDPKCGIKGRHTHDKELAEKLGHVVTLKEDFLDDALKGSKTSNAGGRTAIGSRRGSMKTSKKNIKNVAVRNVTGKPDTKPGPLGKHLFSSPQSSGGSVGSYAGVLDEDGGQGSPDDASGKRKKTKKRVAGDKAVPAVGQPEEETTAEGLSPTEVDIDEENSSEQKQKRQIVKKTGKGERKVVGRSRNVETGQGDQYPAEVSSVSADLARRRRSSLMLAEPVNLSSRPSSSTNLSRCNSTLSQYDDTSRLKFTRSTLPRKQSDDAFDDLMKRSTTLPKVPEVAVPRDAKAKRSPTKEELLQLKRSMSFDRFSRVDKKEEPRTRTGKTKKQQKRKPEVQKINSDDSFMTTSTDATFDSLSTSVSMQWKSDLDLPTLDSISVLNFTRSFTFSFFQLPEHYREHNEALKRAANDIPKLQRKPKLKKN